MYVSKELKISLAAFVQHFKSQLYVESLSGHLKQI